MLVGSSSVLSMEFLLMVNSLLIKLLDLEMMPSVLSSPKPEQENTSQDVSWSTLSQLSLMRLDPELIDSYSIQNNLSQEKKMLLTTSLEVIILLVEKLLIFVLIESENLLIIVLDFKDFWSSMLSEVVLDLVLDLFYWKDFLLIMERSPNWDSLFIPLLRSLLLLLSLTIPFFLLILY